MEPLDSKHAEIFGEVLQQMGVINVGKDEYLHFGFLVQRLYQYVQREQERDMREQANKQQSKENRERRRT